MLKCVCLLWLFGQVPDNTTGMNKRKYSLQRISTRTTHTEQTLEKKTLSVYENKWRNGFLFGVQRIRGQSWKKWCFAYCHADVVHK